MGTVGFFSSREDAEDVKELIESAGATIKISSDDNAAYQLQLLSAGSDIEAVTREIQILTRKSSEEVGKIIQELGIIQHDLDWREAQRYKTELTLAGAQVIILPVGEFTLPSDKALRLNIKNSNDQALSGVDVEIKTFNDQFDREIKSATTDDSGNVSLVDFSNLINIHFNELPPIRFEVSQTNSKLEIVHIAFDWHLFMKNPGLSFLIEVQPELKLDSDLDEPNQKQFLGVVRNRKFEQLKPSDLGVKIKFTSTTIQESLPPESEELDLSTYEGKAIMIRGNHQGECVFSAEVIDIAGPIFTAVVEKLFLPSDQES